MTIPQQDTNSEIIFDGVLFQIFFNFYPLETLKKADCDALNLCLGKGKMMSVGAKIARIPCENTLPKTNSLEVFNETQSDQYHLENT